MKKLVYAALSLLMVSLAGFILLGLFLLLTPAAGFETQGPGLFGAFVLFGSQVVGAAGFVLLFVWLLISLRQNRKPNQKTVIRS